MEVIYRGQTLVYVIDDDRVHHTTDNQFYTYMIMRTNTPARVVIHTLLRDLKKYFSDKGVDV